METLAEKAAALRREALSLLQEGGLLAAMATLGPPMVVGSVDLDLMTWRDMDVWLPLDPAAKGRFVALVPLLCYALEAAGRPLVRLSFNDEYHRPGNPYGAGLYWGVQFLVRPGGADVWKLDVWAYERGMCEAKSAEYGRLKADLASADRELILRVKDAVCRRPEYRNSVTSADIYAFALADAGSTVEAFDAFVARRRG